MPNEKLVDYIADLYEEEAIDLVKEMLDSDVDPLTILEDCRLGVEIVGKRFESGQYFLPDLVMAGEILKRIGDFVKPKMTAVEKRKILGKVLIGTVQGDIHDIGKDIVTFMLEANGFDVIDLGVDVPPQTFIKKILEEKPDIVGLSGLLTIAFDSMKETIESINAAGLRNQLKVMIGGSQVDKLIMEYTGADAYALDAMGAVKLAKKWVEV